MVSINRFAIAALVTPLIFFETVVIDFLNPIFPEIGRYFNAEAGVVQYIVTVFLLGYAVSQIVMGPLSDRWGRKRILVGSIILVVLCHLAGAVAVNIHMLIFSRFLLGLFAGACLSVCLAIIRDIYGEDQVPSVLAHIYSIAGIASILCGLLGGVLGEYWGWRGNFLALAGYFLFLLILVMLFVPETHKRNNAIASVYHWLSEATQLLRQKAFLCICAAAGLAYAGMLTLITLSSFVWSDLYQLGARDIGFSFAIIIASYSIGAQIAAHREKMNLDLDRAVWIGLWQLFISGGAIFLWQSILGHVPLAALNTLMFSYVMGVGIVAPLLAAKIIGPNQTLAGTAAGILTCSGLLLCGFCAFTAAAFYTVSGGLSMSVVMTLNAILALWFYRAILRREA